MSLLVNQLIKWIVIVPGGEPVSRVERVIFMEESGRELAAIDVDAKRSAQPVWYSSEELREALSTGEACVLPIDHRRPLGLTTEDLQDSKKRKICRVRDKRWEVIEPLVTGENAEKILYPAERAQLVAGRTKVEFLHCKDGSALTYSRQSIYAFLYLWWQGGQTKDALFGRYDRCGAPGKGRIQKGDDARKLGRPSMITRLTKTVTGVAMTRRWVQIIALGAALYLDYEKVKDIGAAYRTTLRVHCAKGKVQNEQGEWEWVLPDHTKGEVFSLRQFEYHVRKNVDRHLEVFFRKKYGKRKFATKYRANRSNSTRDAPYPGACVQIDCTIADVYLVSRLNRTHIIGRPVIAVLIDVFSRMIVGICVRPEREKWTVVNLAMMNAIEDKVEFCAKFGVEIGKDAWPVVGLPDGITGDRGTMISYNSDNLSNGLGMDTSNTTSYRPDWKAIVEQLFRQLNIRIVHYLPGAVIKGRERGDEDVRLDAVLDIDQFMKILIKGILYHNNHHYLKDYPLTEEMIKANVKPIPLQIFQWGQKNLSGRPRFRDKESIYTHLLPSEEVSITPQGLKFRGEFYTCDEAEREGWRFRAKNVGNWKVNVGFDPRMPGNIYVRSNDGSPSIRCQPVHSDESLAAKYDLAEIDAYRGEKYMTDQREKVLDMQSQANLELNLEEISAEGKAMAEQARAESPPLSNLERTGRINEHMKTEADSLNEQYRREMSESLGLPTDEKETVAEGLDEYIPRSSFSNVLTIQERMIKRDA